jgi:hypothetical protein
VDERGFIAHYDLGAPVATTDLGDCRLWFHAQQSSGDVWCLMTGPRGTLALPLIQREPFLQVLHDRPTARAGIPARAGERYATWQQVRISDDLTVALRARGDALEFGYLFADGVPFGGGGAGLPTARRASVLERVQLWRSGHRGSSISYSRHAHED